MKITVTVSDWGSELQILAFRHIHHLAAVVLLGGSSSSQNSGQSLLTLTHSESSSTNADIDGNRTVVFV